jgi:hypothetical protein
LGKTRLWTQPSPTSPLRQMILPEDLDSDEDVKVEHCLDSPLQLCLILCGSPESSHAQLEATPSVPFPHPNNYGSSFYHSGFLTTATTPLAVASAPFGVSSNT